MVITNFQLIRLFSNEVIKRPPSYQESERYGHLSTIFYQVTFNKPVSKHMNNHSHNFNTILDFSYEMSEKSGPLIVNSTVSVKNLV